MSDPYPKSIPPNAKLVFEMFPPSIIELNKEVAQHPKLLQILRDQPNKDIYISLLEIATYCDVPVVAEIHTHADILQLCQELTKRLYSKRTQFIIPMA
jgi:hypothetical protein